ncbi:hypothetical protein LIER_21606 [Lithospermum erythrorhizon]|uniref:Uncharacterized protein n=1 Tax=Lithospermum erythrorhizon TaxID=34254 RepID=A0AAV3QU05_LITER
MIREAEECKSLTRVKISKDSLSMNHVLFADGTFIFCRAIDREGIEAMRILREYETTSGQKVNVEKCSVSFLSQTPHPMRRTILGVLGTREVSDQGKYLGLPLQVGRTKKEVFRYIKTKVEATVGGWKGKLSSQVGKEVMVKSVTSMIPNFVMNCFKLPMGIIDDLNRKMAKFFWGNGDGDKGIH